MGAGIGSADFTRNLASFAKKAAQELAALLRQHTGGHLHLVVEPGMIQHFEHRSGGTGFGIVRAVDEPCKARVDHGSGAHRARLQGDVQFTFEQAIVADGLSGSAHGDDLSMRSRIDIAEHAILAARHDGATDHRHRPNGDLPRMGGGLGLGERRTHQDLVGFCHRSMVFADRRKSGVRAQDCSPALRPICGRRR